MCMNSSALDLLVHVDFPVRDISDARGGETERRTHTQSTAGIPSVVGLNPT